MNAPLRTLTLALVLVLVLLAPTETLAWDTATHLPDEPSSVNYGWRSIYLDDLVGELPENEHTWLADRALRQLGAEAFTLTADTRPFGGTLFVTDLNASYFRPDVRQSPEDRDDDEGDDSTTLLEERLLPRPSQFAGLPDYSWTIYDWINKNERCPAVPADAVVQRVPESFRDLVSFAPPRDVCHEFVGWMGALNSNHFGTQARLMYQYYHSLAMGLAERAATMRSTLEEAYWNDYVREAEHVAVIYEAFAQHFLQDRWSMGHMWERWNGPDYEQIPTTEIFPNLTVAAASGILHGAEGVFGVPDPMCSPRVVHDPTAEGRERLEIQMFSHPQQGLLSGVGDYRASDMFNGTFGDGITGISRLFDLPVSGQSDQFIACSMAGFADVIRAFGPGEMSGYGLHEIPLDSTAPPITMSQPDINEVCFGMWATNESVYAGWELKSGDSEDIGREEQYRLSSRVRRVGLRRVASSLRPGIVDQSWRIRAYRIRARETGPDDRTLYAEGGMGDYVTSGSRVLGYGPATFPPGHAFGLPRYREPLDLNELPDFNEEYTPGGGGPDGNAPGDRPGRDRASVHGFFNRAFAAEWCERSRTFLSELRDRQIPDPEIDEEERDRRVETCAFLAQRVYRGVDPVYQGGQREDAVGGADQPTQPLCEYYGVFESDSDSDDNTPYYIHAGYVIDGAPGSAEPATSLIAPPLHESLRAWCRRAPVLDVTDADVAETVGAGPATVTLMGRHLGDTEGVLVLSALEGGPAPAVTPLVVAWADDAIELELPEPGLLPGLYALSVTRTEAPETDSVGRFLLQVSDGLERVSVADDGSPGATASFGPGAVSGDGRFVVFASGAANLVPGDTNGEHDVFVRDRLTGETTRVSVGVGGEGADRSGTTLGNCISRTISGDVDISDDGRMVVFSSRASLTSHDVGGVFVHDRMLGTTGLVSLDPRFTAAPFVSSGSNVTISGDGSSVAFWSSVPLDTAYPSPGLEGLYPYHVDLISGQATLLGAEGIGNVGTGTFGRSPITLSEDGGTAVFVANGPGQPDTMYIRDLLLGVAVAIRPGANPALSGDRTTLAFSTSEALVADDANGVSDIYVEDLGTGTISRVSVGSDGTEGMHPSTYPALDRTGRFVAFQSEADLVGLDRTFGMAGAYLHDRTTGETRLLSATTTEAVGAGNCPAMSSDMQVVTFDSTDRELLSDGVTSSQIYVASP